MVTNKPDRWKRSAGKYKVYEVKYTAKFLVCLPNVQRGLRWFDVVCGILQGPQLAMSM